MLAQSRLVHPHECAFHMTRQVIEIRHDAPVQGCNFRLGVQPGSTVEI